MGASCQGQGISPPPPARGGGGGKLPRVGERYPVVSLPLGYKLPRGSFTSMGASCPGCKINRYTGIKLASCKSALNPPVVCSTDRSKAVVPVLVLLFVALWFILRGDLLCVFTCVILFLRFSVLWCCGCLTCGGGGGGWSWCFSCVCSVCACLDLSVSSFSWGLGRAAVCDCGTPWTFHLPFFYSLLLCGLFYEAICFMSYLVLFCSSVFQSF